MRRRRACGPKLASVPESRWVPQAHLGRHGHASMGNEDKQNLNCSLPLQDPKGHSPQS